MVCSGKIRNGISSTGPDRKGNNRDTFPAYGADGGSCLMTVSWLGALRQGAALEAAYGDKAEAEADTARADAARAALSVPIAGTRIAGCSPTRLI